VAGKRRAGRTVLAAWLVLSAAGCTAAPAGPVGPLATLRIDPTPTARPTRSPTPGPADSAVAGLIALAANEATTYKVALTGRSRHSADTLPVTGSLEVAGAEYRLVADFVFPDAGGESRIEVRVVDGEGWLSIDGDAFGSIGEPTEDDAAYLFGHIEEADDVTLLGDEPDADGRFEVEFPGMLIHPAFIPAVNLSNERVERTKVTLLIDERGRPVSGTWELTGRGRISGQLQQIVMELDLVFSGLGSDIVIRRP
jgi:hypothetical protein